VARYLPSVRPCCAWGSLFTAYSELGAHEPCQNGGTFSGDSIEGSILQRTVNSPLVCGEYALGQLCVRPTCMDPCSCAVVFEHQLPRHFF